MEPILGTMDETLTDVAERLQHCYMTGHMALHRALVKGMSMEQVSVGDLERLCLGLNALHDTIMTVHTFEFGNGNPVIADVSNHDWPSWSETANAIMAAERLVGRRLAKTDQWTLFPLNPPENA